MNKAPSLLLFVLLAGLLSVPGFAQTVAQPEADRLFDFAESLDPALFAPPAETQQASAAGDNWFLRTYTASGVILAVNVDGTGPFTAGDVYALGGPLGGDPVYIESLGVLLAYIDSVTADDDDDGVFNSVDLCPATPAGVPVDTNGCSAVQQGIVVTLEDADKLFNFAQTFDAVTFSPAVTTQQSSQAGSNWYVRTYANSGISIKVNRDGTGAFMAGNVYVVGGPFGDEELLIDTLANLVAYIDSLAPSDDDNDGVVNEQDQCPATPVGQAVNSNGCGASQLDDDGDGVNNAMDQCPATPAGEPVGSNGCSSQSNGGDPNYIVNPGNGVCAAVVLPPNGMIGEFRTSTTVDEGTFTQQRTEEWIAVSQTEVTTKSTATTVTDLGTSETVTETTNYFDFADGLVFLTETYTKTTSTTTVSGLPVSLPPVVSVLESTITYNPMQFVHPQDGFCNGMILYKPPVQTSTVNNPDPGNLNPIVGQDPESTVHIISVAEQITVEAGSFTTLHMRAMEDEYTVDTWVDRETGILVKSEIRDGSEVLVGETELLSLTLP